MDYYSEIRTNNKMKDKKITVYDKVYKLLVDFPELRDSDRKLIWRMWEDEKEASTDYYGDRHIYYDNFMDATSPESIRRSRQKCQKLHPELRSSKKIQEAKDVKRNSKGTFAYREEINKHGEDVLQFDLDSIWGRRSF